MSTLYICLGYCLAPLAFAVNLWRGFGDRSYWHALGERFGAVPRLPPGGVWVHAVSVGEVQAALPLLRELKARHPELPFLLTTSTPTGRARAESLLAGEVTVAYLPYDLPVAAARFLARAQPRIAIILETEIWPNLYRACARCRIPVVLASARVSERSVRRYRRFGGLIARTLRPVVIGAQSAADAERFLALGGDPTLVRVVGNIKFDVKAAGGVPGAGVVLREALGEERPLWVAGSTHEREEEILLDAHRALRADCPKALLVLAPRHPPRFESVANLLGRRGVRFARRTAGGAAGDPEVYLLDTLGELGAFYAAGDVAFVGGSLVPVGGHNLLEPAALGKPVLSGPYTANAAGVATLLEDAGALTIVADAPALAATLAALFADPAARLRAGQSGLAVIAANRGAVARLVQLIEIALRATLRAETT